MACPDDVGDVFGFALYLAQCGDKHQKARSLQGFGGAGVLEVVEDDDGNTYRAVYTVQYADAVYALHVFKKKSKQGSQLPKEDRELIATRLKQAREHHEGAR